MSQPPDNTTDDTDNTTATDTDSSDKNAASSTANANETRHLKIEVTEKTARIWRQAVKKRHGKYREAHSIEGERALRSHADAILDESSPSNAEIMRKLKDIEAAVSDGESESTTTPSDAPSVNEKTSAGETVTPGGDPKGALAYDEIGVKEAGVVDWEEFANEYNHNTHIDPEAVENWGETIKQRSKYRVPITLGMLNYRWEHEDVEWMEESELTKWLQAQWGWKSRPPAYNHRDQLVAHGVLYPSPWIQFRDEDAAENAELVDRMKQGMASRGHAVASADELREKELSRWPGIHGVVESVNPELIASRYYVDKDAWARDVWMAIVDSVEVLNESEMMNDRTGKYGPEDATPYNLVRAFAPFLKRVAREWCEQVLAPEESELVASEIVPLIGDVAQGDEFDAYGFRKLCERVEGMMWQESVTDTSEDWERRLVGAVASADSTEEIRRCVRDAESAEQVVSMAQDIAAGWDDEDVTPAFEVLVDVLDEVAEDVRAPDADARLASRPSEPGGIIDERL